MWKYFQRKHLVLKGDLNEAFLMLRIYEYNAGLVFQKGNWRRHRKLLHCADLVQRYIQGRKW